VIDWRGTVVSRRISYAAIGGTLATGAPIGLLVLRSARTGRLSTSWFLGEVSSDLATYLYVFLSTFAVFSLFGFLLGHQFDRLAMASQTDHLTGLGNRRYFQERLEEEFARANRHGLSLSLLMIDVDGLKEINDRGGHRAGDLALRRAATAIREGSRLSDVAARWGGDEFVLLAPSTGLEEARRVGERIRALMGTGAEGESRAVTVSVGVSTIDGAGRTASPETLVREADIALYAAKEAGRNQVVGS
jgi:diguanylate cyclase (GGDEF)-like protein